MDKIVDALKKILPADQVNEVAEAVNAMLAESKVLLEETYNSKLQEAYETLSAEKLQAEQVAEEGYNQAYEIIQDLRARLEKKDEEHAQELEEGFEEAYQMIKAEQSKNENIEVDLYDEYHNRLEAMKEWMVDKVHLFFQNESPKIYEEAKRNILNDPRMVEHKVALQKIIDITSDYISDDTVATATSGKLDEAYRLVEDLKGQIRVLEAKQVKIGRDNHRLNEQVKEASQLLTEAKKYEKKERTLKAENASGKGKKTTDVMELIREHNSTPSEVSKETHAVDTDELMNEMLILSGLKVSE